MEEHCGLVSCFVMFFILAIAIFVIVYWMDIDEEEKEAKIRQGFDRVEWSNYQINKEGNSDKIA